MIINFGIFAKKKTTVEETDSSSVKVAATDLQHRRFSMALPRQSILQPQSKIDQLKSGQPGQGASKPKKVRASVRLRDKDVSSLQKQNELINNLNNSIISSSHSSSNSKNVPNFGSSQLKQPFELESKNNQTIDVRQQDLNGQQLTNSPKDDIDGLALKSASKDEENKSSAKKSRAKLVKVVTGIQLWAQKSKGKDSVSPKKGDIKIQKKVKVRAKVRPRKFNNEQESESQQQSIIEEDPSYLQGSEINESAIESQDNSNSESNTQNFKQSATFTTQLEAIDENEHDYSPGTIRQFELYNDEIMVNHTPIGFEGLQLISIDDRQVEIPAQNNLSSPLTNIGSIQTVHIQKASTIDVNSDTITSLDNSLRDQVPTSPQNIVNKQSSEHSSTFMSVNLQSSPMHFNNKVLDEFIAIEKQTSEEKQSEFSAIFTQQTEEDEKEHQPLMTPSRRGDLSKRSQKSKVDINKKITIKNRPMLPQIEINEDQSLQTSVIQNISIIEVEDNDALYPASVHQESKQQEESNMSENMTQAIQKSISIIKQTSLQLPVQKLQRNSITEQTQNYKSVNVNQETQGPLLEQTFCARSPSLGANSQNQSDLKLSASSSNASDNILKQSKSKDHVQTIMDTPQFKDQRIQQPIDKTLFETNRNVEEVKIKFEQRDQQTSPLKQVAASQRPIFNSAETPSLSLRSDHSPQTNQLMQILNQSSITEEHIYSNSLSKVVMKPQEIQVDSSLSDTKKGGSSSADFSQQFSPTFKNTATLAQTHTQMSQRLHNLPTARSQILRGIGFNDADEPLRKQNNLVKPSKSSNSLPPLVRNGSQTSRSRPSDPLVVKKKSAIIGKKKQVIQVVLIDDSDDEEEEHKNVMHSQNSLSNKYQSSRYIEKKSIQQEQSDKKKNKLKVPEKHQMNEKAQQNYVKRDLFKSTLNFREMCTGSEIDSHVITREDDSSVYHTRRSYLVEKKLQNQKRSPAKKITEQDEMVLINKIKQDTTAVDEEFYFEPYQEKKVQPILAEKRLRAQRPSNVRDLFSATVKPY